MPHLATRSAAVRPRDAASLLIYRRHAERVQVLMGKRRPGARFLPDVYVFPGGALDAADALAVIQPDALTGKDGVPGSGTALPPQWVQAMAARDDLHAAALLRAVARKRTPRASQRIAVAIDRAAARGVAIGVVVLEVAVGKGRLGCIARADSNRASVCRAVGSSREIRRKRAPAPVRPVAINRAAVRIGT